MRMIRTHSVGGVLLAFVLLFMVAAFPTFAQEATTQIRGGAVWATVAPYLFTTVSAAVVAILTWLAEMFRRWTGIQIEARHRETLHSAAMTGVAAAFNKIGAKADTITLDLRSAIVREGVQWIFTAAPDALKYFDLSPQSLATLVESKLTILLQAEAVETRQIVK